SCELTKLRSDCTSTTSSLIFFPPDPTEPFIFSWINCLGLSFRTNGRLLIEVVARDVILLNVSAGVRGLRKLCAGSPLECSRSFPVKFNLRNKKSKRQRE